MAQFKSREEYEKWKAERQKSLSQAPEIESTGGGGIPKKPLMQPPPPSGGSGGGLSSVSELFSKSWSVYKQRIGPLLGLYLFAIFCSLAVAGLFIGTAFLASLAFQDAKAILIGIGAFIAVLAGLIVMTWGIAAFTYAVAEMDLGFKEALSKGWQRVNSFMWFFSIASFLITGGFLLFVIPGILFLVWFAFGQFILVSEDERGMSALLRSKRYVKGYWFDVFVRLFLIWLLSLVIGIIPVLGQILLLLLVPYVMIFVFTLYDELKAIKGAPREGVSGSEKFRFVGLAILGYLLVPVVLIATLGATMVGSLFLLKDALLSQGGGSAITGMLSSGKNREVESAYLEYRAALIAGDITKLKTVVSAEKAASLDDANAPMMLEMAKALSPKQVRILSTSVTGDSAKISLSGDNGMTGTVDMRRESGVWKLTNESWSMNMSGGAPSASNVQRPYEYQKLTGTWKGHEAGRSGDDWTLTLGNSFDLAFTGPSGEFYNGECFVDNDLGIEGNSMRVLPGGAPFDLRITAGSAPSYIGKISLGSYKLMGDVLQMCGSEPGLMKRTSDFRSSGGIRCFEFRRVSGPLENPQAAQPASSQPSPQASGDSTFSKQDPGLSGEASLVFDGQPMVYRLNSGFFSDTRLKDPARAAIEFRAPGSEKSNGPKIEMIIDSTKAGDHYADGKLLSDSFMGDPVPIGQPTAHGYTASFRWMAAGGQIYFPKPSCVIRITSAHSGGGAWNLAGEVHDCPVHSAGIDHHISSFKFSLRGTPQR